MAADVLLRSLRRLDLSSASLPAYKSVGLVKSIRRSTLYNPLAATHPFYSPSSTTSRGFLNCPESSAPFTRAKPDFGSDTLRTHGIDFLHYLIVLQTPEGNPTKADMIDSFIQTVALVVGSIAELRWVLPDFYVDIENKKYGGDRFIDGKVVPNASRCFADWEAKRHVADGYSVCIKGLPFDASPALLEDEFKRFGVIKSGGIQVQSNQDGICSQCSVFVEFEEATAAQRAIKASPLSIGGHRAFVEEKRSSCSRVNRHAFSSRGGYQNADNMGSNGGCTNRGDGMASSGTAKTVAPQGSGTA